MNAILAIIFWVCFFCLCAPLAGMCLAWMIYATKKSVEREELMALTAAGRK